MSASQSALSLREHTALGGGGRTVARFADMEDRILIDPAICNGRPIIAGTRIAVQTVLEFLGAGDEIADVLEEYPSLTREDVLACLRYSSHLMGNRFTLQKVA